MLQSRNSSARCSTASFAQVSVLSVLLSGCHPFGCGSSRCVDEHIYAGSKRCNAVLQASLVIVRNSRLPSNLNASAIRSELIDQYDRLLANGAKLGMPGAVVYQDAEKAKIAYLRAFAKPTNTSPQQKMRSLREEVKGCTSAGNE